jgi:chemotaxis protein methyltransferase CheR
LRAMNSVQQEIGSVLAYLQERTGLDFSGNQASMITRRLQAQLSKVGVKSFPDYLAHIKENDGEIPELIDALTINVTQFFRDSFTWEYFRHEILPGVCSEKEKSGHDTLRIWSAGCASGEEAYSAALLVKDYADKQKLKIKPMIFATDINQRVLELARSGVYSAESVCNIKHGMLEKYFSPSESNFAIDAEIRHLVSFSAYDMLARLTHSPAESIFGTFDIIICRNLLIYFNADIQELILEKIYRSLNINSLLILGESERPLGKFRSKFIEVSTACRIYRKL